MEQLGANDEFVRAITQGNSDVDKTVDAMVDESKLADPKVRKALIEAEKPRLPRRPIR